MKEHTFKEKLAAYVAVTSAYLAAGTFKAEAQIMYTDVMPDDTIHQGFFNLDLNNDGVVDFKLSQTSDLTYEPMTSTQSSGPFWNAYKSNHIFIQSQNRIVNGCSALNPFPINQSDTINAQDNFGIFGNLLRKTSYGSGYGTGLSGSSSSGCFLGNDKYLGLKIIDNGETHYGWARLTVEQDKIILKDYAINDTPDSSILAGEGSGLCSMIPFTIPSGPQVLCNSLNVELFNFSGNQIQWIKNGSWMTGETDSVITINESGDYYALVLDSANCNVLVSSVSTNITPELSAIINSTGCANSLSDINLFINGYSPPYTYLWNTGSTVQDIGNLLAGSFIVSVTDNNGCMNSDTFNIINPFAPPTLTESHTDTICGDVGTGTINLELTGGQIPYSFEWDSGDNTEDLTNLYSGVYSVTVTDANGCSTGITISIYNHPNTDISELNNTLYSSYPGKNQWYYWSVTNPLYGDTMNYYVPTSFGTFFAEAVYNDSCTVMSAPYVFWYDGVNMVFNPELSHSVTDKIISFHLSQDIFRGDEIIIYNELGQQIASTKIENQNPEIDLSLASSGIYFYHIRSKQKYFSGKFLIE